jgi:hypothetical protein
MGIWIFKVRFSKFIDDMEYEKVHLFIDPITTDTTFTDSGYEKMKPILVKNDVVSII